MKKFVLMMCAVMLTVGTLSFGTGCTTTDVDRQEVYEWAADKVFQLLDTVTKKRLEKLLSEEKITQTEYEVMQVRLEQGIDKLRELVDQLYEKHYGADKE